MAASTKINQIIAVEKGIKSRVHSELSELYKIVQKPDLFNGFSKSYKPNSDDGENLPPESKRVQHSVEATLRTTAKLLADLLDVTAVKDWSNCHAVADITLDDGTVLVPKVPVTYLLFLEKQVTDIRTFFDNLPVLDSSEDWTYDKNSGLYKTREVKTHRTKKTQKAIVLYDATQHHPAQTQLIAEDHIVGFWGQVKQSGAIPKPEKEKLVERVEVLLIAIKKAREAANGVSVTETPNTSEKIFNYLLGARGAAE